MTATVDRRSPDRARTHAPATLARRGGATSSALTRRNLVHVRREPAQLSDATVQPVLFTVLFVYIFGAAMVIPGGSYKHFAIGGLVTMNLTTATMGTAVGVSSDLKTGVIDRFRTLPMARSAILAGRTFSDLLASILCATIVVITGFVIGWRPGNGVARRGRRPRGRGAVRLRAELVHRVHRPVGRATRSRRRPSGC